MLKSHDIDLLIFGHTHRPYHRKIDNIHLVNAGSVGRPLDGDPRACYVLINVGDTLSVTFQRVAYDINAVTEAIERSSLPQEFTQILQTGRAP